MTIHINQKQTEVPDNASVAQVLDMQFSAHTKGIAVAVNSAVVPRVQWSEFLLNPNDEILIVTATQGG